MQSLKERIVHSSDGISSKVVFCVLATKLGTKEKVQEDQPLEYLISYDRHCNLLTLLAEASTKKKYVSRVRCLSVDSFRGSQRDKSDSEVQLLHSKLVASTPSEGRISQKGIILWAAQ